MDIHDLDLFYSKKAALKNFAEKHQYEKGVEVLYYDSYGKFPCLRVTVGCASLPERKRVRGQDRTIISCPFNEEGTHKFKSWKNYAKVRITRKGEYGIEYTVERIAGEEPRRGAPQFVNADEYLRGLMTRLGRQRMPYDRLNSRLPQRLEVFTYDMDLDPDQREFVPVDYNESWQRLLEECFKDLLSFPS